MEPFDPNRNYENDREYRVGNLIISKEQLAELRAAKPIPSPSWRVGASALVRDMEIHGLRRMITACLARLCLLCDRGTMRDVLHSALADCLNDAGHLEELYALIREEEG